jgi:hypothetical protein
MEVCTVNLGYMLSWKHIGPPVPTAGSDRQLLDRPDGYGCTGGGPPGDPAVALASGVGVGVGVSVGVSGVAVSVACGVAVGVGVSVASKVGVAVGVSVASSVGVGVGPRTSTVCRASKRAPSLL